MVCELFRAYKPFQAFCWCTLAATTFVLTLFGGAALITGHRKFAMIDNLIRQRTLLPTRKVGAGLSAGTASVVLVAIAEAFGISIPAELASAITTIAAFAVSWIVRERAD